MQKHQRLTRELSKLKSSPPQGICVFQTDDLLNIIESKIIGPEDTPYAGGVFALEILIPDKYPFSPPTIKFLTKIYHPNIDENGRICLDIIKMPPTGSWKPTIGLEGLLIAVRMLMENPNPDDALMAEIGIEYKNCHEEFVRKARDFTKRHAC